MDNPKLYGILLLAILILLFFNIMLSRDIYNWVSSVKKQILLYLLVRLQPIVGFFLANKLGNLGWFNKQKENGGSSVISGGLRGQILYLIRAPNIG